MAGCPHTHKRTIAKDEMMEFVECLDCGDIFEVQELTEAAEPGQSLSDA